MNEGGFEEQRREAWDEYERLVTSVEKGKPEVGVADLPRRFREVCSDLALASHRMYRGRMVERLNALVIRGYPANEVEASARGAVVVDHQGMLGVPG